MSLIQFIGTHHAGGLGNDNFASTAKLSLAQIDAGHKMRWPTFPSAIKAPNGVPYYTGYTIVSFPDGTWVQTRRIGDETAAQVGHNFDTISICFVGNFMKRSNGQPVDTMTPAQIATGIKLIKGIMALDFSGLGLIVTPGTSFKLSVSNIQPHRILQPNHTDCHGTYLPNDWGRQLAMVPNPTPAPAPVEPQKPIATPEDVTALLSYYSQIQLLWMKIQDIFAKKRFGKQAALGGEGRYGRCCENLPFVEGPDFQFSTSRE